MQDGDAVSIMLVKSDSHLHFTAVFHLNLTGINLADIWGDYKRRVLKACLGARSARDLGRVLARELGFRPRQKMIFRLKWRVLMNSERYFLKIWGTICISIPHSKFPPVSP